MENQNYSNVLGTGTGNSAAPFLTQLLKLGATIPRYSGGFAGSSASDYCAMVAGDITINGSAISDSNDHNIGTCTTPTVCDLFAQSSLSWNVLQETGFTYAGSRHDGFLQMSCVSFFDGTNYNQTNCTGNGQFGDLLTSRFNSHINDGQNAGRSLNGGNCSIPSTVVSTLNQASPPRYIWVTPGDAHNMHDNLIGSGDQWLQSVLCGGTYPPVDTTPILNPAAGTIFSTTPFTNNNIICMLWWDENSTPPNLFYGPGLIKQAYISPNSYNHYSTLKFQESILGLNTLGSIGGPLNDTNATAMTEVLIGH
jgi:hypothetical protein